MLATLGVVALGLGLFAVGVVVGVGLTILMAVFQN